MMDKLTLDLLGEIETFGPTIAKVLADQAMFNASYMVGQWAKEAKDRAAEMKIRAIMDTKRTT